MRSFLIGSLFAGSFLFGGAAQAVPAGGLPEQVCIGPAGDSNPNCRVNGGGEATVPEPRRGRALRPRRRADRRS